MSHGIKNFTTAFLLLTLLPWPATAAEWLSPENEQNAARALLGRLQSIGIELEGEPSDQLAGAVLAIRGMAERIDGLGRSAMLAQAPQFSEPVLPDLGDPLIQAIAAYGTCSLTLHPELAETQDEKYFVAAGEFAVLLVSGFLRQQYLADGGTDQQLAEALTSADMVKYSQAVQQSQDDINRALTECQPFYQKVVGTGD